MKKRMGFVSNSSSSSFVVLIPKSFDIDKVDFSQYEKTFMDYETNEEEAREAYKVLMRDGCVADQEFYGGNAVLDNVLRPYIISELYVGPDEGSIVLVDEEKIREILG